MKGELSAPERPAAPAARSAPEGTGAPAAAKTIGRVPPPADDSNEAPAPDRTPTKTLGRRA
jgi:hypothetical protein